MLLYTDYFFFCNMVYDVIMVKLGLLCTFISLGANNSPKTTILIYRWWHLCQINSFVPNFFPSDKKQHYSEGIFCILAANANVQFERLRSWFVLTLGRARQFIPPPCMAQGGGVDEHLPRVFDMLQYFKTILPSLESL